MRVYKNAKVYTDGSHFIAIPQTTRPSSRKTKQPADCACEGKVTQATKCKTENEKSAIASDPKREFERLYKECSNSPKKERTAKVAESMKPYFDTAEETTAFVNKNIERVQRNKIARMVRLMRKARLQDWNYFCTFTYDDKKHTEDSFRKSFTNCLRHLSSRKGWKYIGVWERSPSSNRLHFHGIFYIPPDKMVGTLEVHRDYDTKAGKMQDTYQNTHFNDKYGRSDFKAIAPNDIAQAIRYLIKYIDKSGERLIYSRGLPTYFVSDIMDEDVATRYGIDDRKLLLFDDFTCWNDGCYVGKVSPETISKLPKSN